MTESGGKPVEWKAEPASWAKMLTLLDNLLLAARSAGEEEVLAIQVHHVRAVKKSSHLAAKQFGEMCGKYGIQATSFTCEGKCGERYLARN